MRLISARPVVQFRLDLMNTVSKRGVFKFLTLQNNNVVVTEGYVTHRRSSMMKEPALLLINDHLGQYPTPSNLSYAWEFGFLAAICLMVQIATGIFLAMHYTAHIDLAFSSVEHIMRDVNNGWLIRYHL